MTRNFLEFADTVPGMVFQVDAKRPHLDPWRRAEHERREPVHRRRGPEGLRALGRVRPGRRYAGQSVPAARHRRIQGHHLQLQGGIRPDLQRRHHGASRVRAPTASKARPSARTRPTTCARARRPRIASRTRRRESETKEYGLAFGGPIIQDRLHFFLTYEAKRYVTPETVTAGRQSASRGRRAAAAGRAGATRSRDHRFRRRPVLRQARLGTHGLDRSTCPRRSARRSATATRPARAWRNPPRSTPTTTTIATSCRWKHNANRWLNEVQLTLRGRVLRAAHHQPGRRTAPSTRSATPRQRPEHHRHRRRRSARRPEQGPEGLGHRRHHHASPISAGSTVDHTIKAGREVQGHRPDRRGRDPRPARVLLTTSPPRASPPTPWKAVFALPLAGFDSTVDLE